MEGQQFCLRWHNFQNTLLSTLPKLLDGGYLTDVTLSAGGRHIRAHRIILSACSYYFKELFKDLSTLQHPVIVLPGMEYANLCALVTFMYNGEVNIYQEQLPALLAMADTLHIRGLADIAGKNSHNDNGLYIHPTPAHEDSETGQESTTTTTTTTTTPAIKEELNEDTEAGVNTEILESIAHPNESTEDDNNVDKVEIPCSVKTKPYYSINAKLAQKDKKQQNTQNGSQHQQQQQQQLCSKTTTTTIHEKNLLSESNCKTTDNVAMNDEPNIFDDIKNPNIDTNFRFLTSSTAAGRSNQMCNKTSVTCLICGKQLSNQYNLRVHMETHSNSSYSCSACSHVSRSRDALRKHVSYRHPVATPQKRPRYSLTKP